jgi:hypothetical protein
MDLGDLNAFLAVARAKGFAFIDFIKSSADFT